MRPASAAPLSPRSPPAPPGRQRLRLVDVGRSAHAGFRLAETSSISLSPIAHLMFIHCVSVCICLSRLLFIRFHSTHRSRADPDVTLVDRPPLPPHTHHVRHCHALERNGVSTRSLQGSVAKPRAAREGALIGAKRMDLKSGRGCVQAWKLMKCGNWESEMSMRPALEQSSSDKNSPATGKTRLRAWEWQRDQEIIV